MVSEAGSASAWARLYEPMLAWALVVLMALSFGPGLAVAATPDTFPTPIRIRVIRSVNDPACGSNCNDWIALDGHIGSGSSAAFANALRQMRGKQPAILVDSPGGLVNEAMAIGRLIRSRHLDVAVGKAVLASCPADRSSCAHTTPAGIEIGAPTSVGTMCASACPLILAGGVHRLVSPRAVVGVHEFKTFRTKTRYFDRFRVLSRDVDGVRTVVSRTLISHTEISRTVTRAPPDYATTKRYLIEMGVDPNILSLFRLAPPERMFWVSHLFLQQLRLETSDEDGAYLVFHGRDLLRPGNDVSHPSSAASGTVATTFHTAKEENPSEMAMLQESYGQHRVLPGRVRWSVKDADQASVQGPRLIADMSLSDDLGSMEMQIDHMAGTTDPSLLRITVSLRIGVHCPIPLVQTIGVPTIRQTEYARATYLQGVTADTSPQHLTVLLPQAITERAIELGEWFDVPLTLDGGTSATISFARGVSGENALLKWEAQDRRHSQDLAHMGVQEHRS